MTEEDGSRVELEQRGVEFGGELVAEYSTFFDGARSDDYFNVAEARLSWSAPGSRLAGRLAAGCWWHTGDSETFAGGVADGTNGYYLQAEQRLSAPAGEASESGVYLFGQYGSADPAVADAWVASLRVGFQF